MNKISVFFISTLLVINHAFAQTSLGTTYLQNNAFDGYTLFHPHNNTTSYLINNQGELVHKWAGFHDPGNSLQLLESGLLLRTGKLPNSNFTSGGIGGRIELVTWEGDVVWNYELSNDYYALHHEVIPMPNGNLMAIVWERIDESVAIANGRDPELLTEQIWSEKIIEFKPLGFDAIEIVWEWRVWDHLIQNLDSNKSNYGEPADCPNKINLNYVSSAHMQDWLHINSVDYNEELDLIVLSSPFFNEFWVIDHSTTTEEAKGYSGGFFGKGGDVLYRWGNPKTYNRGGDMDKKLFGQHNVQWLKRNGKWKILLYNNGRGRPDDEYSTIEILEPPLNNDGDGFVLLDNLAFGPQEFEWTYSPSETFYSSIVSGVQFLENGNMLICVGRAGRFFEIDPSAQIVWNYQSPIAREQVGDNYNILCSPIDQYIPSLIFRARKYSKDFAGFPDDFRPSNLVKLEQINCPLSTTFDHLSSKISPNELIIESENILNVRIFDIYGKQLDLITNKSSSDFHAQVHLERQTLYLIKITYIDRMVTEKILFK